MIYVLTHLFYRYYVLFDKSERGGRQGSQIPSLNSPLRFLRHAESRLWKTGEDRRLKQWSMKYMGRARERESLRFPLRFLGTDRYRRSRLASLPISLRSPTGSAVRGLRRAGSPTCGPRLVLRTGCPELGRGRSSTYGVFDPDSASPHTGPSAWTKAEVGGPALIANARQ